MLSFLRSVCALAWLVVLPLACSEPHPFYLGADRDPADANLGDGNDMPMPDAGLFGDDTADAGPLFPDGGQPCSPQTCAGNFGAAPCGAWMCQGQACQVHCPNCEDNDKDGFGEGAGCAGRDCDDADPQVRGEASSRVCYSGPQGTRGNGACRAGVASCSAGIWSECQGQQAPLPESCNGEDDDCDGQLDNVAPIQCGLGVCASMATACSAGGPAVCPEKNVLVEMDDCGGGDEDCDGLVDEDCDACARVSTSGNDTTADGSALKPFRSVQAAIDWAHADPARPQHVCVAAGLTCQALGNVSMGRFVQPVGKALVMRNGVSVTGGYEAATWTLCPRSQAVVLPAATPTLALSHLEGIVFGSDVKTPTALSGFRIERAPGAKASAAITINGAQGAIVSHVAIEPGAKNDVNLGIDIKAQAQAIVMFSQVVAGNATQLSIAVRVKESSVQLINNCAGYDGQGRCNATCSGEAPGLASGTTDSGNGESFALLLDATSAARVSNNSLCAGFGKDSAGAKLQGNATNTVINGNHIHAEGGLANAAGLWLQACGGHSPWILGNANITASADSDDARLGGVVTLGNCHPRIEANANIAATGGKSKTNASGILCAAAGGFPSFCQILRNTTISGTTQADPERVAGIRCLGGSCGRISANKRIFGGHGKRSVGLWLEDGITRVDRNEIWGGCGTLESTGVLATNAGARIENNVIFGATCSESSDAPETTVGVQVLVANLRRSLDLHSNTINGAQNVGNAADCMGAALVWGSSPGSPGASTGIVRNNILSHRLCEGALFVEQDGKSAPRWFEHNLFDPTGKPSLWRDSNNQELDLSAINRNNGGSQRRGNLEGDPMFLSWPLDVRLDDESAAINEGTSQAAPVVDFDAKPRGAEPDVGAFEK